jgi:putative DNA primase/helicase
MTVAIEEKPLHRVRHANTRRVCTAKLQTQQINESDVDPFKLAREYVNHNATDANGHLTMRYWRASWYRYQDGQYAELDESAMRVELTGFIKAYFDQNRCVDTYGNARRVTRSLVANTLNALSAIVAVAEELDMPVWLDDDERGPFLAVRNGLLDISGLPGAPPHRCNNSPLWFSTVAFPVDYDPKATCPRWLAFLREVMEGDPERIEFLQEWAGYLLTPDTTLHRFVVAEGEGANGKSVFLDVLTALLGPENVAHVPLEMFGVRFQLTVTLHKLANICAEVGDIDRVAEGFLKQFTAGDRMYFDRKNISGVMAYPTARLMLSSNNRPRFRDRTAGLWRRMIIVPFRVTIPPERQDPQLTAKLKQEIPGIFQWALEGLTRLCRRGSFAVPALCQETLEDYRQESNPAKVFLSETCSEAPGASVRSEALYENYGAWCRKNGFDILDARQFGKEVKRIFPKVKRERGPVGLGRPWSYRGMSHVS